MIQKKQRYTEEGHVSDFEREFDETYPQMVRIIDESLRVLKPGCKFVIWPNPSYLMRFIEKDLHKRDIRTAIFSVDIPHTDIELIKKRYWLEVQAELMNRLVLTKPT